MEQEKSPFADAEVISVYTRAQAIADGELVDVTRYAILEGFKYHTAFTRSVYAEAVTNYCRWMLCPEIERLHAVLDDLAYSIRKSPDRKVNRVSVVLTTRDPEGVPYFLTVVCHCGPGDDAAPVVTIMQPDEE